jgi:hypothetical protein
MSELRSRHPRATLALGMLFLAMTLWAAATWPARSQAYTVSNYCENQTLGPESACEGAERTAYAIEGWGSEWSICVYAHHSSEFGRMCTSGTEHVYDPFGQTISMVPGIDNNTVNHTQVVHGRVYQP